MGGDTAGTGHRKDMTGVHNCHIYFEKSDVMFSKSFIMALTFQTRPDLQNLSRLGNPDVGGNLDS